MSATNDYLESVYKEIYKAEIDRSDKLDAQINPYIIISTALIGILIFYADHRPEFDFNLTNGNFLARDVWVISFYLATMGYVALVFISVYFIIHSYTGKRYRIINVPTEIDQNVSGLIAYHNVATPGSVDAAVKEDIQKEILDVISDSASFNRATNLERTNKLHTATKFIIRSLIALVVSRFLFYVVEGPQANTSPQKAEAHAAPATNDSGRFPGILPASVKIEQKIDITPRNP